MQQALAKTKSSPMMALMQRNLELNAQLIDRCEIRELNWGEDVPKRIPSHPDILLLADCVYLEVAFQPLVDTLVAMTTTTTEILVSIYSV
jgi:predicted nicotinamide N-methyase